MKVLALDTATNACSVALWEAGRILAARSEARARGHAEILMPMVMAVMAEAGLDFKALDLLAVTVGPGGFTGLRIGLAAARGMALAAGRPLVGVTTLEAVARGARDAGAESVLLVVLDAKRSDYYAQMFGADLAPLCPPCALPPAGIVALARRLAGTKAIRVAGDVSGLMATAFAAAGQEVAVTCAPALPDAAIVAAIAGERRQAGLDLLPPDPLYLRPPDISFPKAPS